jgi:hypothetical protein
VSPREQGEFAVLKFPFGRREFITFFGAAVIWPLKARAQQSAQIRRIGLIIAATEENDPEAQARITAFREGLAALGGSKAVIFGSTIALPAAMRIVCGTWSRSWCVRVQI